MKQESSGHYTFQTDKNCVAQIYKLLELRKRIKELFPLCKNTKKENDFYLQVMVDPYG